MNTKEALYNYCLRLGDNNLILGQRLAEWCSKGPILEEDLAMTNLSLDHFGQAEFIYEYAAELNEKNSTADEIAFQRNEREYCNALIVEQPNGDFAFTMVKQMLFSSFAKHLYESLSTSNDKKLSELTARALKEMKYHFRHSSEWIIRLGNGTEESHKRTQQALNELWMFTDDLFEMNQVDRILIEVGISVDLSVLHSKWKDVVGNVLKIANLNIPQRNNMIKGGYNGMHTEHLGHLLCEMQHLQRAYPQAKW